MSPWLPALANFVLPGTGYLILKRRVVFAWLVIAGTVLWIGWGLLDPGNFTANDVVASAVVNFGFAYDAYQEAKGRVL
jgi:hypothetical protein